MKGTKTLRAPTVAALATAVGLGFGTPAQAELKLVAPGGTTDAVLAAGMDSYTYAKETLPKAPDSGTTKGYSTIGRPHYIAAPVSITAATGDTYYVSYKLHGMVFAASPTLAVSGHSTSGSGGNLAWTPSLGAAGDDSVVFRLTGGSLSPDGDDTDGTKGIIMTLTANFALGPDGMGSITRTVANSSLDIPGIDSSQTLGPAGIIKTKSALKEDVMAAKAPVATAASDFKTFKSDTGTDVKRAAIGSVQVGVYSSGSAGSMTYLLNAAGTGVDEFASNDTKATFLADSNPHDVRYLEQITFVPASSSGALANPVKFSGSGGLGFAKKLYLAASAACEAGNEIRKPAKPATTPATYMDETEPEEADTFGTKRYLCVEVDGETEIPESTYTVTTSYKGFDGTSDNLAGTVDDERAAKPMGGTREVGSIVRDGTQFNIPYLSDNDRLKQRITIQNRGQASSWTLTNLETTMGSSVVAVSGKDTGDLPMGQTVIKVWEHIDVTGAARASGSINIPLPKTAVSASVDIVDTTTGRGIATMMLTAE